MKHAVRAATARIRAFLTAPWSANPRTGLAMIVASALITIAVAFCGPSSVALKLGPRIDFLPPWYLPVGTIDLSEWVAVPALWLGLTLGAIGLWLCWRAVNTGWRPNNRRLFLLGSGLSIADLPRAAADLGRRADVRRLRPPPGARAQPLRHHAGRDLPPGVRLRC